MAQVPFTLAGLDHVVFRVSDLERMLAFYRGVLGCETEKIQADLGLYQLRAGRSLIDLITMDGRLGASGGAAPGAEGRNVDHVAIAIAPFDEAAIREHLAAHGVEIEQSGPRYGADGMGPSIYVRDPEGNLIELKGPPLPL